MPNPVLSEQPGLLERCKLGDNGAWGDLITRYARLVFTVPKRMGMTQESCEDVVQETFIALYRSIGTIHSENSLAKWLLVTSTRKAYQMRRRTPRNISFQEDLDETLLQVENSAPANLLEEEQKQELHDAVDQLPETCRDLMHALFYEEKPYNEISDMLHLSKGSIGPMRSRCLEKLSQIVLEP